MIGHTAPFVVEKVLVAPATLPYAAGCPQPSTGLDAEAGDGSLPSGCGTVYDGVSLEA